MAAITGVFQIVWIYYGLLIASRPVIAWNTIGALLNLLTVGAYMRFSRSEARLGVTIRLKAGAYCSRAATISSTTAAAGFIVSIFLCGSAM
jgi:hypothetical protein